MVAIAIENGRPIPAMIALPEAFPLSRLELGQSIWIAADHPDERTHWRRIAESATYAHTLASGKGYVVRTCRRGNGDNTRGVRIWCTSIPAAFIRIASGEDCAECADSRGPRARSPD